MKKLTELQQFRLNLAHSNLVAVLQQLKIGKLSTRELERMKRLEASVQELEGMRLMDREG